MDPVTTSALAELAANLTTLAVKGTVSKVSAKIKSIQNVKEIESVRNTYDELINELLSEREEAIRIAQVYKSELERYQISDDDITHLHATIESVLEIFQKFSPETDIDSFKDIKDLVNIDTLKAIQLLGFNYKKAIGEPLTDLCASKINSLSTASNRNKQKRK